MVQPMLVIYQNARKKSQMSGWAPGKESRYMTVFPIKSDPRSYNKAVNFFLIQKTVVNIQGYFCWMPAHRLPLETSSCKKIKVFIKIAKERTGHGQSISTTDRNRNKCHGGMENAFPPWTMVLAREKLCAQIMYIR